MSQKTRHGPAPNATTATNKRHAAAINRRTSALRYLDCDATAHTQNHVGLHSE